MNGVKIAEHWAIDIHTMCGVVQILLLWWNIARWLILHRGGEIFHLECLISDMDIRMSIIHFPAIFTYLSEWVVATVMVTNYQ